ncbi:hypothetical protein BDP81DRAFT_88122 [Colletotrichum phormii]|uniref:Uncharacterized protein n=1 Tax=Colletotrichum phormii TaxID=359342 RepID=A0AAJ0A1J1_9PEZI|nr:uncharacterized protein BDP81DRAFT_88122 [Colletotrichum phormii]KAK1654755.1 hypothetical protein BDP81DRAFT_88122 [Colletotrichum phormii]
MLTNSSSCPISRVNPFRISTQTQQATNLQPGLRQAQVLVHVDKPQTMPLPLPRISSPTDTDTRSYASPASSQPSRIPARPARQRAQLSSLKTFPAAPLNCRSIPTAVTRFSLASSQCSPTFKFHSVCRSVKSLTFTATRFPIPFLPSSILYP